MTQKYSLQSIDTTIWVTFQKEGIHFYPDAPEGVEFLRHPHRHIFHFFVEMEVFHDNRDVEFILLKRELESLYDNNTLQLDYKSCEMLARDLLHEVAERYPDRDLTVKVSEDGENGATLRMKVDNQLTTT